MSNQEENNNTNEKKHPFQKNIDLIDKITLDLNKNKNELFLRNKNYIANIRDEFLYMDISVHQKNIKSYNQKIKKIKELSLQLTPIERFMHGDD